MEELGVGDSTWLYGCPQGHTSPTFSSEETTFIRFLLLVCIRRTTRYNHVVYGEFICKLVTSKTPPQNPCRKTKKQREQSEQELKIP